MKTHRLLDGTTIILPPLSAPGRGFLRALGRMIRDRVSYFEIYRFSLGPGSPALQGRNRVDRALVQTPLYRVAEDLATRAGVDQGLILAPEHEHLRPRAEEIEEPLSVVQAADLIGITRIAAYKAIREGRLPHVKIGNVLIVRRPDAEAYKRGRETPRHKARSARASVR